LSTRSWRGRTQAMMVVSSSQSSSSTSSASPIYGRAGFCRRTGGRLRPRLCGRVSLFPASVSRPDHLDSELSSPGRGRGLQAVADHRVGAWRAAGAGRRGWPSSTSSRLVIHRLTQTLARPEELVWLPPRTATNAQAAPSTAKGKNAVTVQFGASTTWLMRSSATTLDSA